MGLLHTLYQTVWFCRSAVIPELAMPEVPRCTLYQPFEARNLLDCYTRATPLAGD